MEYNRMLGEFIACRRKALGLTQKELAAKVGVSDKAVSKWETLEANPDISLLLPLSEVLKVSAEELLKGEISQNTEEKNTDAERQKNSALKNHTHKYLACYIVFTVLSVLLGILTLFSIVCLGLAFQETRADRVMLCIFSSVLAVVFASAFFFTVKQAVRYSVKIQEIPTELKEVDGYVIYRNLSREEKKALMRRRRKAHKILLSIQFSAGTALLVNYVLGLFFNHLVIAVCLCVLYGAMLAVVITNAVLQTKWLRKNKIIMNKRDYERIKIQ